MTLAWWNMAPAVQAAWQEHYADYVTYIHECPACHVVHENRTPIRELCKECRDEPT